jgi:hypothetical protein
MDNPTVNEYYAKIPVDLKIFLYVGSTIQLVIRGKLSLIAD